MGKTKKGRDKRFKKNKGLRKSRKLLVITITLVSVAILAYFFYNFIVIPSPAKGGGNVAILDSLYIMDLYLLN